ncbi:MAG: type II toxin-antitoxin system VapC family toxin [Candidatus Sulfotelmatobacter sp.]|jgi:predicted nucleic acid-binding protein
MSLVLDSSVALAWVYADEATDAVLRLFDEIRINSAWVPALWRWEIANVLQLNVRRGRHAGDFRDGALSSLAMLPVKVDAEADRQAWSATLHLAERHGLTVYDAAYLEIASCRKIPMATLDRQLRAAAGNEGVQLLDV